MLRTNSIKLFISLLIAFCLLFLASTCSNADYGIPSINNYTAIITNENGVNITDYKGNVTEVIPKGTEVLVTSEYSNQAYIEYNNQYANVSLEDISPVSDNYNIEEDTESLELDMYVYKEGCYLYKGPSITFDKVDSETQIPAGTVIHLTNCSDLWGYTEYNGIKGWVYIYTSDGIRPYDMTCSVTYIANKQTSCYYTLKDINLVSYPGSEEVISSIPANTSFNTYFYSEYPDPHGHTVYVELSDTQKGWYTINEFEVLQDYSSVVDKQAVITSTQDLYQDMTFDSGVETTGTTSGTFSNVVGQVPERTLVKVLYSTLDNYQNYIKVEYNGQSGWINSFDAYTNISSEELSSDITAKTDLTIVDLSTLQDTGSVIQANTTFKNLCMFSVENGTSYYYCIGTNYNGNFVFVKATYKDYETSSTYDSNAYYNLEKVDLSPILKTDEEETSNQENDEQTDNPNIQIGTELNIKLIIGIIIAVILVVIAIISIKKLNTSTENKSSSKVKAEVDNNADTAKTDNNSDTISNKTNSESKNDNKD